MTLPKFDLLKEEKSSSGGSSKWTKYGTTADVNIIDIAITTTLDSEDIPMGSTPQIIPRGPRERTCKLVGSFINNTIIPYKLGSEETDPSKFEVIQNNANALLGLGLRINDPSNLLPEMDGNWRINEFSWNRDSKKLGLYDFSMTLGYIWEIPGELNLWADNCATEPPQNVKFYINVGNSTTAIDIFEPKIFASIHKMNTASFKVLDLNYNENTAIKIYCQSDKVKTPVFYGVVKEKRNTSVGTIQYTLQEKAIALHEIRCTNPEKGIFKPRQIIRNPTDGKYLTISEMANTILKQNYSGHQDINFLATEVKFKKSSGAPDVSNSLLLPGRSVKIPNQILSGCTVGTALDNFLVNQCGLYVWYPVTGGIETGFIRDVITSINKKKEFIQSSTKLSNTNDEITPDYVIVFSSTGRNPGYFPSSAVDVNATSIAYKLNTDLTDRSTEAYAAKIYNDLKLVDKSQFRVTFPAGTTRFKEGDVFSRIGDLTTSPEMKPRSYSRYSESSLVWQIMEVTITESSTDLIVGPSYRSILDIYGSHLQKCDEVPSPTEVMTWKSAEVAIGKEGTA